jgi:hypothetical protein
MGTVKIPEGTAEILGSKISSAGILAMPEKRLEAMGLEVIAYAKQQSDAAYQRGLMEAADIAASMAERPYDNEPEFSAMLDVELAIRRFAQHQKMLSARHDESS